MFSTILEQISILVPVVCIDFHLFKAIYQKRKTRLGTKMLMSHKHVQELLWKINVMRNMCLLCYLQLTINRYESSKLQPTFPTPGKKEGAVIYRSQPPRWSTESVFAGQVREWKLQQEQLTTQRQTEGFDRKVRKAEQPSPQRALTSAKSSD